MSTVLSTMLCFSVNMGCCLCWPFIIDNHGVAKWKFCTTTHTCLNHTHTKSEREMSLLPGKPWGMRSFMGTPTHTQRHTQTHDAQWLLSRISECEYAKMFFGALRACVFSFLFVFACTASFRAAEFPRCLHTFSSPNLSNAVTGSELGERMKMRWVQQSTKALSWWVVLQRRDDLKRPKTNSWTMEIIWGSHKWSLFIINLSCHGP